jgi:hypothetical protein
MYRFNVRDEAQLNRFIIENMRREVRPVKRKIEPIQEISCRLADSDGRAG